ncbi:ATP-binding protein [Pseudomonas sp. RIT778]|uniref:ATP-binding protein n=1 Tax=Pseudomonas sp. RIT778 TaxID=2870471 RepID=UPI001C88330D|nr:ATP-binding protein [Pseudomonas sp. RIT778]MBX8467980.1 ATP-binding protein [Pseudomonas sp. RIT778]
MTFSTDDTQLELLGAVLKSAWSTRSPSERNAFAESTGVSPDALIDSESAPAIGMDETASAWAREAVEEQSDDASSDTSVQQATANYPQFKPALETENLSSVEPSTPIPLDADLIASIERHAALSGALQPKDLVAGVPPPLRHQLLDQLAPSFDRTLGDKSWLWTLKSDRRTRILKNLDPAELQVLVEKASAIATDQSGETLRQTLKADTSPTLLSPANVDADLQALTWALPVRPDIEPQLKALRRDAYLASLLSSYDYLLKDGFFGRSAEISRIHAFATALTAERRISILSITGVGGSGKSTLLAAALRPLTIRSFEDISAPMIVYLDFDRRAFLIGAELELSFELTRQLGQIVPAASDAFEQLREQTGRERVERGEHSKSSVDAGTEAFSRQGSEFDWRARDIIELYRIDKRALILVIDTFEEWQRENYDRSDAEAPFNRILDWLSSVQNEWNLAVGIIISGRASVSSRKRGIVSASIELEHLNNTESSALLKSLDVPAKAASRLAAIVGGIPLSLKLAARYFNNLSKDSQASFLEGANTELKGVSSIICQGILYKRFLDHIVDPQARKLAHPGLALRQVTPQLIKDVLAIPCNLGELSLESADNIFQKLSREVWLVEMHDGVLMHVPQIRRVMLDMMNADPLYSDKIRYIHQAAVQWYAGADRSDEDKAEALYHAITLADPNEADWLVRTASRLSLARLVNSVGDFSPTKRVLILDQLKRKLTLADARLLPEIRRTTWMTERANEQIRLGQVSQTIDMWNELVPNQTPGHWYATAIFQSGRWHEMRPINEETFSSSDQYLSYHYLLAGVLRRIDPAQSTAMLNVLAQVINKQVEGLSYANSPFLTGTILENIYFQAIIDPQHHLELTVNHDTSRWIEKREEITNATQYLRISSLKAINTARQIVAAPRQVLAGIFQPTPEFFNAIAHSIQKLGGNVALFNNFAQDFSERLENHLRLGMILGQFSDSFADAVIGSFRKEIRGETLAQLTYGMVSDDPEWRVLIRLALTSASQSSSDFAKLSHQLSLALEPWAPIELAQSDNMNLTPSAFWLGAIEYVDRCRRLPRFMAKCTRHPDEHLQQVAKAYLEWAQWRDGYIAKQRN